MGWALRLEDLTLPCAPETIRLWDKRHECAIIHFMTTRHSAALADFVVIAICPALIMAMVGSLVFFLLEVFYVGQYQARLQWVFACFVFATVLIARISMMHDGGTRAPIYGILLAIPTFLATLYFIEYQSPLLQALAWPINGFILALIWWSAHKLTYDCTYEDESSDASGRGLLEAAGLDPDAESDAAKESGSDPSLDEVGEDSEAEPAREDDSGSLHDRKRKPETKTRPEKRHTPGVWIVYFSLAALPLFGLGQLLLPAAKRGYGSWLLAAYVASGLGLLLCTSFLNLRRYLRERKVPMPHTVTAAWLVMGAILIGGLVGFGLIIPWPSPEGMPESLGLAGSKDRQASRWSPFRDSPGKGPGSKSNQGVRDPQARTHSSQVSGHQGSQPGQVSQGTQGSRQGNQSSQGGSDQQGQGRQFSDSAIKSRQNGQNAPRDAGNSGQTSDQPRQGQSNDHPQPRDSGERADRRQPTENDRRPQQDQREETEDSGLGDSDQQRTGQERDATASAVPPQFQFLLAPAQWLATLLKWIALIVAVLAGGYFLVRFLANAGGWFSWLFTRRTKEAKVEPKQKEPPTCQPAPFSAFSDPFLTGAASRWPPSEVIRYTFEALEAWAWERGLARQPDETPLEFAQRLGEHYPRLALPVRRVSDLFVRMSYARQVPTSAALPVVRELWQMLSETSSSASAAATTESATLVQ